MKKFTVTNFVRKMRDPKQRKYFFALFGGKLLGVGLVFLIMAMVSMYFGGTTKVHAQTTTAPATTNAPVVSATNVVAGTNAPAGAPAPAAPAPPDPPYCSPI